MALPDRTELSVHDRLLLLSGSHAWPSIPYYARLDGLGGDEHLGPREALTDKKAEVVRSMSRNKGSNASQDH